MCSTLWMWSWIRLWGVLAFLVTGLHSDQNRWTCRRPIVEVLVSPLVSPSTIRSLILSWSVESVHPGDYVALYLTDVVSQPLFTIAITSLDGWVDTGIPENRSAEEPLAFTEQCLGYWAALKTINSTQVIASSCLGTAPRWMERNYEVLQNMSLKSMFLPGTHNSAAYVESWKPFRETLVQRYSINQDERVLNQLIYGVRVLDLRVGHYASSPEVWWANHGVARMRPLFQILEDVLLFTNMTKEIVILDIHRFPVGFQTNQRDTHQTLVRYLEGVLGERLISPRLGWSATLGMLWQTGRRIILSYNYNRIQSQYMWPGVVHKWGNVRSVTNLYQYFTGVISRQYPYAWSAMAELTPTAIDIFTGRLGSLRQLAHMANANVTTWFRHEWGATCNIVSVDFLRSSGVVRSALDWNLRRARSSQCDI